jgi:hypothetical protein
MSSGPSLDELASMTGESRARLVRLCLDHGIGLDAVATWVRTGEMDRHLAILAPAGVPSVRRRWYFGPRKNESGGP